MRSRARVGLLPPLTPQDSELREIRCLRVAALSGQVTIGEHCSMTTNAYQPNVQEKKV